MNGAILKIEFHPGDTIFFIDDREIGSTGPEYVLQKISFDEFLKLVNNIPNKEKVMFLLLPMIRLKENEVNRALQLLESGIKLMGFKPEHCSHILKMIVEGLL